MEEFVPPRKDALVLVEKSQLMNHEDGMIVSNELSYSSSSLTALPDDIRSLLASFLPVSNVLSLLSVNRDYHFNLGGSPLLWRMLYARDGGKDLMHTCAAAAASSTTDDNVQDLTSMDAVTMKKECLRHSYLTCLPSVRWRQLKRFSRCNIPSSREGHCMCILGPPSSRMLVLTGGFSSDNDVHMLPLNPPSEQNAKWIRTRPTHRPASFVYGASLTAFDETRAVRYGGFRGGGYSSETAEVCVLTLRQDGGGMEARWQTIAVRGRPPPGRAYHSATLIHGRYLLVVGGMKSNGCVLMEAVLDVETWTWLPTRVSSSRAGPKPSERHGHSIVLDEERNRLVLFGGASGSDLLRSGRDNSEVWELKMKKNWKTDFEASFPWKWSKLHNVANETENAYGEEAILSRKERLCLGRCHISGKVASNTVLLAFGSGRPSTNGVIAYDLCKDTFFRPQVLGRLPTPRFTAVGAIFDGWLVVHGGYSVTNHYGTLGDVALLDLAPGLRRTFEALPTTTPWLQEAMTVLTSLDDGIKTSVGGQSLSLLRRFLLSVVKAYARLSRKALLMVRRGRRRLQQRSGRG